jgi:hypothetical protein
MEPIILQEQVQEPEQALDAEDMAELLMDCLDYVDTTIQRGLPNYLKPNAFKLLERLQKSVGWVTVH